jgi:hypothetical protein
MPDDECIHGMSESSCGICRGGVERPGVRQRPKGRRDYFEGRTYTYLTTDRPIYAAGSGYCAHYDEHCQGFTYGAATVVAEVSRSDARRRGLFDCDVCVTPWHQRDGGEGV